YLAVYLRGSAALDKQGRRIGRELQQVGRVRVLTVEGRVVRGQVHDATGTVTKGMAVKLGGRP
ncbi:MAG TPA: hypothetical protein PKI19_14530, partial [Elusimicrobiales bacterium]|nr:hypothetical protein [Elusimicrobiales bacterium]